MTEKNLYSEQHAGELGAFLEDALSEEEALAAENDPRLSPREALQNAPAAPSPRPPPSALTYGS
jgi:hypothetical protein